MSNSEENTSLVNVISSAIKIPGVKVNRASFLCEAFENEDEKKRNRILEVGPVEAGCSRKQLMAIAKKYVNNRTLTSTGASFVAGIPGGIAMAATIPADTLQFFGVALRLAQEISYIYGAEDLWDSGEVDTERVQRYLILYCGVMFGVGGAAATLRVVSSAMGKQLLRKLPQMALTKTFFYPIIKSIAKAVGLKMTKDIFAKGASKVVPVIGGVVSGAITYATMRPMGLKLVDEFDEVKFNYSQKEFESDWSDIQAEFEIKQDNSSEQKEIITAELEIEQDGVSEQKETIKSESSKSVVEQIKEAKELLDSGIITEEEFNIMKSRILS